MNNSVEIKYKGQFEPLKNQTLWIPSEFVGHGHVYPSAVTAILDAISKIPKYESIDLPGELWDTIPKGDRIFLLNWEVVMNPI